MLTQEQARGLAQGLELERWTPAVTLDNGASVRAKLEYDVDSRLEENGDEFGAIHWPERDSRARPAGCDGSARKIVTRNGPVWWQPPKDVVSDVDALASLEKRVREYFHEYWTYVGVVVEVTAPACVTCGERKRETFSLWGIESDSGAEHFAEVIADLTSEANVTA